MWYTVFFNNILFSSEYIHVHTVYMYVLYTLYVLLTVPYIVYVYVYTYIGDLNSTAEFYTTKGTYMTYINIHVHVHAYWYMYIVHVSLYTSLPAVR